MSALPKDPPSDGERPAWWPTQDEVNIALTGTHDFVRAILDDPSMLERMPKGGPDGLQVVIVGEGVPPRDMSDYAGKAVYVHSLTPEGVEELRQSRETYGT